MNEYKLDGLLRRDDEKAVGRLPLKGDLLVMHKCVDRPDREGLYRIEEAGDYGGMVGARQLFHGASPVDSGVLSFCPNSQNDKCLEVATDRLPDLEGLKKMRAEDLETVLEEGSADTERLLGLVYRLLILYRRYTPDEDPTLLGLVEPGSDGIGMSRWIGQINRRRDLHEGDWVLVPGQGHPRVALMMDENLCYGVQNLADALADGSGHCLEPRRLDCHVVALPVSPLGTGDTRDLSDQVAHELYRLNSGSARIAGSLRRLHVLAELLVATRRADMERLAHIGEGS